jgi:membrane fusion protein, heavy metal efflux system
MSVTSTSSNLSSTGGPVPPADTTDHGRSRRPAARAVAGFVVFALLTGAFVIGHSSNWQISNALALFGGPKAPDDWCVEHLVPESICVECNDKLLPKLPEHGFCRRHGVAECVICHPDLAQVQGEPELPRYDTAAALTLVPRAENNSRNTLYKHRLQFATAESASKSGIEVDAVQTRPMADAIIANGEITFDPTRVAHLASRAGGTVAFVFKSVGDRVEPGDILALVDASNVGQAKAQLLQAIVQLQLRKTNAKRLRAAADGVATKSIVEAEAAWQEAEVAFLSARQSLANLGLDVPDQFDDTDPTKIADTLRFLGIPAALLAHVAPTTRSANLFPVRASHGGIVMASDCVAGEVVDATTALFTVADPTRLWLTLNVRQEDVRHISLGLQVVFRADDHSKEIKGRISWISPAIDERTRTVRVRADLDAVEPGLKDKMFGTGRIVLREEANAISVPREAVQSTADASYVFVRDRNYLKPDAPKVFHVRQVRIGAHDESNVELLAGALAGEVVATKGSPALLAQLLRGSLGAGCGCHEK